MPEPLKPIQRWTFEMSQSLSANGGFVKWEAHVEREAELLATIERLSAPTSSEEFSLARKRAGLREGADSLQFYPDRKAIDEMIADRKEAPTAPEGGKGNG